MLPARNRLRLIAGIAAIATLGAVGGSYAAVVGGDLSLNGAARRNTVTDRSAEVAAAINPGKAKNVILLIGDGMGDSEITVARNYAEGAAGRFKGIDALPLTGQYTTYSLTKAGLPDYVPDSAATGSAWATGTKTYDNAVSVDLAGKAQETILELAKASGLKTGDVTTSEIQDATPAVQVSHISQRGCYGPTVTSTTCTSEALENGGPGSITEQLLNTRPDVTLGGGSATFSQTAAAGPYQGKSLTQQATERGYQMVSDKAGLAAVTAADQTKPLLGLFATGNMAVRYTGPAAVVGGSTATAARCTPNPALPATQPNLAEMTDKAIKLLDNPKGFFLQVEGASIDKRDHGADACGQIGETVDLDEAVQVALAFAKAQGNTSVFVTADHGHSSQIIEVGSTSPGLSTTLTTADGSPMSVNYGTSALGGSQQHTGTQVRVAGYGPQAANIVGLTDQSDLFFTMKNALFGTGSTPPSTPPATPPAPGSSVGAKVKIRPGVIRVGGVGVAVGRGFRADTTAVVTLKSAGKKKTKTKSVAGGVVVTTLRGTRKGTVKVTVRGVQSGVSASDKVQVKKR